MESVASDAVAAAHSGAAEQVATGLANLALKLRAIAHVLQGFAGDFKPVDIP